MKQKTAKSKNINDFDIKVVTSKIHKGINAPEDQLFYTVKASERGKVLTETELGPATFEFKMLQWTYKGDLIKKFRLKYNI